MKNNPGMMQDNTVNSMINGMNPKIPMNKKGR